MASWTGLGDPLQIFLGTIGKRDLLRALCFAGTKKSVEDGGRARYAERPCDRAPDHGTGRDSELGFLPMEKG